MYFVDYKKNNHIPLSQWTPFSIPVAPFQALFANDACPQLYDADVKTMFTHDAATKKCCLISSLFCILYMIPVKFRCEFSECSHDAVCLMVYFRFVSWDLVHKSHPCHMAHA